MTRGAGPSQGDSCRPGFVAPNGLQLDRAAADREVMNGESAEPTELCVACGHPKPAWEAPPMHLHCWLNRSVPAPGVVTPAAPSESSGRSGGAAGARPCG